MGPILQGNVERRACEHAMYKAEDAFKGKALGLIKYGVLYQNIRHAHLFIRKLLDEVMVAGV